jgi:hypothetical protein
LTGGTVAEAIGRAATVTPVEARRGREAAAMPQGGTVVAAGKIETQPGHREMETGLGMAVWRWHGRGRTAATGRHRWKDTEAPRRALAAAEVAGKQRERMR